MEVREPSAKYLSSQFKRTEAGDIPIDWIDKPIGEMAEVTAGGTPSRQVAAFWDGDIPWITTAEIDGGQVTEASRKAPCRYCSPASSGCRGFRESGELEG
jgi:type I restriction enzyme S subunit